VLAFVAVTVGAVLFARGEPAAAQRDLDATIATAASGVSTRKL
jgi:hypothetical protein